MKRILSVLLAVALLLTTLSFSLAEEADTSTRMGLSPYIETVESVETISVPMYVGDAEAKLDIDLLILNGITDVPYVNVEMMISLMSELWASGYPDYAMEISKAAEGMTIITRENGAAMVIDTDTQTITFTDPDLFARMPGAANGLDLSDPAPQADDGSVQLYTASSVLYREKNTLEYCLADYDIYMYVQDGTVYIPLQTVSDILLSMQNLVALYNRKCVIIASDIASPVFVNPEAMVTMQTTEESTEEQKQEIRDSFDLLMSLQDGPYFDLARLYYDAEPCARSVELAVFNYNELCMVLDHYYGLKEEHQIDSFDSFFKETGIALSLLGDDAFTTYHTLVNLIKTYIADGHSGSGSVSSMAEMSRERYLEVSAGTAISDQASERYSALREQYFPEGPAGYVEIGNTAIITFDTFEIGDHNAYYTAEPANDPADTVALILYANSQINRENSPIERVVIDLSLNGGGKVPAAICVVSWVLGSCDLRLENAITDTQAITRYQFDANLDHMIDEQDCLLDNPNIKGVYVLISPVSFSCANLVPASLKGEPKVTIVGKTSGGGACIVQTLSTADGNTFNVSGSTRLNTIKNGILYSVDEGVTPDVYIDDMEHLYNRQYLVDLINRLN